MNCERNINRTFPCILVPDHDGPCEPFRPPTLAEWAAACHLLGVERRGLGWSAGGQVGATPGAAILNLALVSAAPDLDAQVIAAVQRGRKQ